MFDSIFNLNQDLLLEMRYSMQILTASGTRWNGFESPGMRPLPDPSLTDIADSHRRRWSPMEPPFVVIDCIQPYFKIHGSSNWATGDGRNLLVMGGDKEFMIQKHKALRSVSPMVAPPLSSSQEVPSSVPVMPQSCGRKSVCNTRG
jgi:hypothetical protein